MLAEFTGVAVQNGTSNATAEGTTAGGADSTTEPAEAVADVAATPTLLLEKGENLVAEISDEDLETEGCRRYRFNSALRFL